MILLVLSGSVDDMMDVYPAEQPAQTPNLKDIVQESVSDAYPLRLNSMPLAGVATWML